MFSYPILLSFYSFFFNDTATTEIYTLSLHDALPISSGDAPGRTQPDVVAPAGLRRQEEAPGRARSPGRVSRPTCADRKSTRLNSSHSQISYAVFCLKKKKKKKTKHKNKTKKHKTERQ